MTFHIEEIGHFIIGGKSYSSAIYQLSNRPGYINKYKNK